LKSEKEIIALAKSVLLNESEALKESARFVNRDFFVAVKHIFSSKGRVVVTGIGKSAQIAGKIVATFNSTGTPSVFMHAADAIHGDLGTIQKNDTIICLSKSGNTPEIKVLAPLLKRGGNKLIAIVGNTESYLASQADYVINASIDKEACPNNLAPTTSTTVQLGIGDALAVCLLACRGFNSKDFARYHPGGSLGKKLYLKVGDIAAMNAKPAVNESDSIEKVIVAISSNRLGATAVMDSKKKLTGIITDGDLRRMLQKEKSYSGLKAKDIMGKKPKSIDWDSLAADAYQLFREHNITQLIVTKKGKYEGFIHFHDLIREGIL
jgi:arabinose-5-phosphate isomerase